MTTLEILEGALAKLRQGWCQGDYSQDGSSKVCIMGAVHWMVLRPFVTSLFGQQEVCTRVTFDHMLRESMDASALIESLTGYSAVSWNDAPSRTFEDIEDLFGAAIAIATAEAAAETLVPVGG